MNDNKIFDLLIDGKLQSVYKREEEHKLGTWNKGSDNYWLKLGDEFVPYLDSFVFRPAFRFEVEEKNYTKEKWGSTDLRNSVIVKIFINNTPVYQFSCRDTDYALARCNTLRVELLEHPLDFVNMEKIRGRLIWYRNQPGVLVDFDTGEVTIRADSPDGFDMRTPYDIRIEDDDEYHSTSIRTDIFDRNIYWFRDP